MHSGYGEKKTKKNPLSKQKIFTCKKSLFCVPSKISSASKI